MRLDSERRPFGFLRGPNRGETGMFALTTAFPHPHRLRNEKSQRKITWRQTVGDFFSGQVEYLDDLDYSDDLAVLACTQAPIREKTDNIASHTLEV